MARPLLQVLENGMDDQTSPSKPAENHYPLRPRGAIAWGLPLLLKSLHNISWNVHRFHSTKTQGPKKLILRQELQPALVGWMDMLLLQKHKLSAAQTSRCGKVLPRCSHTYWEPSIAEQGRSGPMCTSIRTSLMHCVFGGGTLVPRPANRPSMAGYFLENFGGVGLGDGFLDCRR